MNHEKQRGFSWFSWSTTRRFMDPPLLNHENHENQRGFSWFIPTKRNNVDFPGSRGQPREDSWTPPCWTTRTMKINVVSLGSFQPREITWIFLVLMVNHEKIHGPPPVEPREPWKSTWFLLVHSNREKQRGFSWFSWFTRGGGVHDSSRGWPREPWKSTWFSWFLCLTKRTTKNHVDFRGWMLIAGTTCTYMFINKTTVYWNS